MAAAAYGCTFLLGPIVILSVAIRIHFCICYEGCKHATSDADPIRSSTIHFL